jgi:thiamine-monophosphate kinase
LAPAEQGTHSLAWERFSVSADCRLLYIFPMPLPELLLIERIRSLGGKSVSKDRLAGATLQGIGDDCAVLAGSKTHDLLVTTDLSIEDTHFRLDWHPPDSVGHRCLARGLSDIAAMGGEPTAAFLSLALPPYLPQKWVDGFFTGFHGLARRFGVPLAGGDIAANPGGVAADIIVLGRVPRGKAILRSGAHSGDHIYVTGTLGCSAAVVAQLQRQSKNTRRRTALSPRSLSTTKAAHFFPTPRLEVGWWLMRHNRATAMIDISDGLSTDLAHIVAESGVSAVLFRNAIPHDNSGRALDFALHGGEDYELLFTASPKHKIPATIAGSRITRIGEIVRQRSGAPPLVLVDENGASQPFESRGWEHFSFMRRDK